MLKHLVRLDCAEVPRDGTWDSHKAKTIPVLIGFQRLLQLVSVLLEDDTKRIHFLISLGDGGPNLLAAVLTRIQRNNRKFLAVEILFDGGVRKF